jgi:hypothetical protein
MALQAGWSINPPVFQSQRGTQSDGPCAKHRQESLTYLVWEAYKTDKILPEALQ